MLNEGGFIGVGSNGGQADRQSSLASGPTERCVRPTLYIGLGGTGYRIGVHLKALFARREGGLPDWFRLLVLDTAQESFVARLEDEGTVGLEAGSEFINIGHVPVGRIVRHRAKHRAIVERFGESLAQLPPTVLRHGAKQIRLLGLLALYWHFHEVEERLQQMIWHLAGRETGRKTVVEGERGINVFVASSTGGGTGAGTFLDMGYLVRTLVEELGDLGDFCQITGVGVLPGAFPNVDAPFLEANTVASLVELNHAMTQRDFCATYPNSRALEPMAPPFDLYYVVDGVDERGRVWSGIDAVCQQTARALYLQIASQLGRKGENDFDNLDDVLSGITSDGVGTFLGSVGLGVCQFDAGWAYRVCARRQALRLVREAWRGPVVSAAAEREAAAFWEGERLDPEWLMEDLAIDEAGVRIGVDVVPPARLRQLPLRERAEETVAYVDAYRGARLEGSFQAAVDAQRGRRGAAASECLRDTVVRLVDDPSVGVAGALAALHDLEQRLNRARERLRERHEDLEGEVELLSRERKRRSDLLLQASTKGLLGRTGRLRAAQRRYLAAASKDYGCRFTRIVCSAALRMLDELSQTRSSLVREVARLDARLRGVGKLLSVPPRRASVGMAVDLELADKAYVDELYSRYAPSIEDAAAQCLEGKGNLLMWADRPAAELARWLERRAAEPFNPVLEEDVETVLRRRSDQVSTRARRLWLLERATPSWNLDRSRLADGGTSLASITVLGVPDIERTAFVEQSKALVSTGDKQRIMALRATVGAPHTALRRFPGWQRAYEAKRHSRPLHVLPAFHASEETAIQAFALGLVFQLIYAQGSWYYYQPLDRLDEPERLAQGLDNAVGAFATEEGLAVDVLDRVDRIISMRLSTEEAIERLDAYTEAGQEGGTAHGLDRQLRKAARDYADGLRSVLAASEGIAAPIR